MRIYIYLIIIFIAVNGALLFWKFRTPLEAGRPKVPVALPSAERLLTGRTSKITEVEAPAQMPAPVATQRKTYATFPGVLPEAERTGKKVHIVTAKGEIIFELFGDEAPKTVSNFITLARDGFYNGLIFHRREEGFVIQGGDPNGNGTGGPGYKFEDEPVKRTYSKGIVAMANSGPNTNGSQFFIMLGDTPLPPLYTIFGNVLSGQDVVDRIQVGDVMERVTIE